jgi:hypothetical protein
MLCVLRGGNGIDSHGQENGNNKPLQRALSKGWKEEVYNEGWVIASTLPFAS